MPNPEKFYLKATLFALIRVIVSFYENLDKKISSVGDGLKTGFFVREDLHEKK
jgi:hypothetical protein